MYCPCLLYTSIWVLFALPDGTTPKRESDAALFHAHAYRMAVKCYQPLLPFAITLKEPSLTQSCRMTLDGYPYYNPAAVPFCLEQPLGMPEEENFRQRKLAEKNPLLRLHPDSKEMCIRDSIRPFWCKSNQKTIIFALFRDKI